MLPVELQRLRHEVWLISGNSNAGSGGCEEVPYDEDEDESRESEDDCHCGGESLDGCPHAEDKSYNGGRDEVAKDLPCHAHGDPPADHPTSSLDPLPQLHWKES